MHIGENMVLLFSKPFMRNEEELSEVRLEWESMYVTLNLFA